MAASELMHRSIFPSPFLLMMMILNYLIFITVINVDVKITTLISLPYK